MQRNKYGIPATSAKMPQIAMILAAIGFFAVAGCRNTTTTPVSPLGGTAPLSPLAPVQGTATLSPIQTTSGISNLGAPTRVPPPPTGSYNVPGSYGATSSYVAPPSGASLGSTGFTRGVTDLSSTGSVAANGTQPAGTGVRQTGWVAETAPGSSYGSSFPNGPSVNLSGNGSAGAGTQGRTGGMPVIDLTKAPYPPGYVPPQNRPGAVSFPSTPPYPTGGQTSQAAPQLQPAPQLPTAPRVETGYVRSASVNTAPVTTAGRAANTALPSTEPFPTTSESGEQLQWRRPSPKF